MSALLTPHERVTQSTERINEWRAHMSNCKRLREVSRTAGCPSKGGISTKKYETGTRMFRVIFYVIHPFSSKLKSDISAKYTHQQAEVESGERPLRSHSFYSSFMGGARTCGKAQWTFWRE